MNRFLDFFRTSKRGASLKDSSSSFSDSFLQLVNGFSSKVKVNSKTSLSFAAYWRCVNLLSSTVSKMPIHFYQKSQNGRDILSDNPLQLLLNRPNNFMTSETFFRVMEFNRQTEGNAYAVIKRGQSGGAVALIPYPSKDVELKLVDNTIFYHFKIDMFGNSTDLIEASENVIHLIGCTTTGIKGLSPIVYHSTTLSTALSSEKLANDFYKNSAKKTGYLRHPGRISDIASENLKKSWNSKDFDTPVLMEGVEFVELTASFKDIEFIQSRKYSALEICRIFGVPTSKIYDMDKATYNNLEQQNLEFYIDTILPLLISWEQELKEKLLFEEEKVNRFFKFNVSSLLRADTKTRYEAYATGIRNGFLSVNEVRTLEDANEISEGSEHYLQAQMRTLKNINSEQNG